MGPPVTWCSPPPPPSLAQSHPHAHLPHAMPASPVPAPIQSLQDASPRSSVEMGEEKYRVRHLVPPSPGAILMSARYLDPHKSAPPPPLSLPHTEQATRPPGLLADLHMTAPRAATRVGDPCGPPSLILFFPLPLSPSHTHTHSLSLSLSLCFSLCLPFPLCLSVPPPRSPSPSPLSHELSGACR